MATPAPLPPTMAAVRVHGPGDLRVDRVPTPTLATGDVLVRVSAAGVCATDRKLAARGAPGGGVRTLGHEIVGVVATSDHAAWPAGTRVAVAPNLGEGSCPACLRGATNLCPDYQALGIHLDGGLAEYVRVPGAAVASGHLLRIPEELSDLDAVLLEPLACCVEGLETSGLRAGESLLVVAAGVMGRLHVVAGRVLGAGTIVVVDRNEARLAHARALGADAVVLAGTDVETAVRNATGGRGVDVAALTVGDAAAAQGALALLARGGRLNLFGGFGGGPAGVTLDANRIHYEGLVVLGTTGASKPTLARTLDVLHRGRPDLTGLVSAVHTFDEATRAFADAGETAHARVVLRPATSEDDATEGHR